MYKNKRSSHNDDKGNAMVTASEQRALIYRCLELNLLARSSPGHHCGALGAGAHRQASVRRVHAIFASTTHQDRRVIYLVPTRPDRNVWPALSSLRSTYCHGSARWRVARGLWHHLLRKAPAWQRAHRLPGVSSHAVNASPVDALVLPAGSTCARRSSTTHHSPVTKAPRPSVPRALTCYEPGSLVTLATTGL
jgi:hypothetical protein